MSAVVEWTANDENVTSGEGSTTRTADLVQELCYSEETSFDLEFQWCLRTEKQKHLRQGNDGKETVWYMHSPPRSMEPQVVEDSLSVKSDVGVAAAGGFCWSS